MGKFEDRLLADLVREHGPALATTGRPGRGRRPVWVAAAVLAGAAVAGTSLLAGGNPAYAVTRNVDGTVTVSISDVRAVHPANRELERLGVPARAVPTRPGCPVRGTGVRRSPGPIPMPSIEFRGNAGSFTIPGGPLPPRVTFLLGVTTKPGSDEVSSMTVGLTEGPVPDCLPAR